MNIPIPTQHDRWHGRLANALRRLLKITAALGWYFDSLVVESAVDLYEALHGDGYDVTEFAETIASLSELDKVVVALDQRIRKTLREAFDASPVSIAYEVDAADGKTAASIYVSVALADKLTLHTRQHHVFAEDKLVVIFRTMGLAARVQIDVWRAKPLLPAGSAPAVHRREK